MYCCRYKLTNSNLWGEGMKVKLGELINVKTGKLDANAANENGLYPFFTCSKEPLRINTYTYDCECVLVAGNGDLNVKYYKGKFDAYQRTYILESSSNKLYMPYLYFFMDKYVDTLRKQSIGGVIKYIKLENITNASLELIDINKQKEICNKIYKVKELIDKQKKIIDHLDTLIKARFVEMFGDPVLNNYQWEVKKLKDLSVLITNGTTPDGGDKNYKNKGIMFLRSQNIWKNRMELDEVVYISEEMNNNMKKSQVQHNDILITKTGRINTENSSLGRAALFEGKNNCANINGHVYLVRLNKSVLPKFVLTILIGDEYREYIRKVCVGGIDKRQINIEQVENFPIILPDIKTQEKFCDFVQHIDKLKFDVQKSLEKTQMLFDSLMQKYFG